MLKQGLKKAFSGLKDKKQEKTKESPKQNQQDNKPFSWNPQPANIPQNKNQKQGQINIPNYWAPKNNQQQNQQEKEDVDEEPYWSAEEWEAWALEMFDNYPDYRKVLPEWFVEAASE